MNDQELHTLYTVQSGNRQKYVEAHEKKNALNERIAKNGNRSFARKERMEQELMALDAQADQSVIDYIKNDNMLMEQRDELTEVQLQPFAELDQELLEDIKQNTPPSSPPPPVPPMVPPVSVPIAQSYVSAGAKMTCPFAMGGTSVLTVLPNRRTSMQGPPKANIMDNKPMVNIPTFGMCSSMVNPQVASATAAALGVLTPQPCIPNIAAPWVPGKANLMIENQPALLNTDTLQCLWGGMITIIPDPSIHTGSVPPKPPKPQKPTTGIVLLNITYSYPFTPSDYGEYCGEAPIKGEVKGFDFTKDDDEINDENDTSFLEDFGDAFVGYFEEVYFAEDEPEEKNDGLDADRYWGGKMGDEIHGAVTDYFNDEATESNLYKKTIGKQIEKIVGSKPVQSFLDKTQGVLDKIENNRFSAAMDGFEKNANRAVAERLFTNDYLEAFEERDARIKELQEKVEPLEKQEQKIKQNIKEINDQVAADKLAAEEKVAKVKKRVDKIQRDKKAISNHTKSAMSLDEKWYSHDDCFEEGKKVEQKIIKDSEEAAERVRKDRKKEADEKRKESREQARRIRERSKKAADKERKDSEDEARKIREKSVRETRQMRANTEEEARQVRRESERRAAEIEEKAKKEFRINAERRNQALKEGNFEEAALCDERERIITKKSNDQINRIRQMGEEEAEKIIAEGGKKADDHFRDNEAKAKTIENEGKTYADRIEQEGNRVADRIEQKGNRVADRIEREGKIEADKIRNAGKREAAIKRLEVHEKAEIDKLTRVSNSQRELMEFEKLRAENLIRAENRDLESFLETNKELVEAKEELDDLKADEADSKESRRKAEEIKKKRTKRKAAIKKNIKTFTDKIGLNTVAESAKSVTGSVGNKVKSVTGSVGNKVKSVTGSVGNKVKPVTSKVGDKVKPVTSWVGNKVGKPLAEGLPKGFSNLRSGVNSVSRLGAAKSAVIKTAASKGTKIVASKAVGAVAGAAGGATISVLTFLAADKSDFATSFEEAQNKRLKAMQEGPISMAESYKYFADEIGGVYHDMGGGWSVVGDVANHTIRGYAEMGMASEQLADEIYNSPNTVDEVRRQFENRCNDPEKSETQFHEYILENGTYAGNLASAAIQEIGGPKVLADAANLTLRAGPMAVHGTVEATKGVIDYLGDTGKWWADFIYKETHKEFY